MSANQEQQNKRARTARPPHVTDAEYWAARSAAYMWPQQRRQLARPPREYNDDPFRSTWAPPYHSQYAAPPPLPIGNNNASAASNYAADASRSPYSLNRNPTRVWVVHSVQGRGVHGLDYGPVGAPFPERRVVVGTETGFYNDGAFQPDLWFPRKVLVRVGNWSKVVAFEVGPPGEAYPLCAVAVFRWGKIHVGKIVFGGEGPEFVLCMEETIDKFAGLHESDLDPDQFSEPVSVAVWTALAGVRQRCETINNGGRLIGVPNNNGGGN